MEIPEKLCGGDSIRSCFDSDPYIKPSCDFDFHPFVGWIYQYIFSPLCSLGWNAAECICT